VKGRTYRDKKGEKGKEVVGDREGDEGDGG